MVAWTCLWMESAVWVRILGGMVMMLFLVLSVVSEGIGAVVMVLLDLDEEDDDDLVVVVVDEG